MTNIASIYTDIKDSFHSVMDSSIEFEKSLVNLGVSAKSNSSELRGLKEQALELGRATKHSSKEIVDSMSLLANAGFKAKELQSVTNETIKLATVGNIELAKSSDILSGAIAGFELGAKDSNRVIDILSDTARNSGTNIESLSEALSFASKSAKRANVSFEEASAIAGTLEDAGVRADVAGKSMKNFFNTLNAPPKDTIEMLEELKIEPENLKNLDTMTEKFALIVSKTKDLPEGEQLNIANRLFGRQYGEEALTFMEKFDSKYKELLNSAKEADHLDIATKEYEELSNTLDTSIKKTENSLEILKIQAIGKFLEPLNKELYEAKVNTTEYKSETDKLIDTMNEMAEAKKSGEEIAIFYNESEIKRIETRIKYDEELLKKLKDSNLSDDSMAVAGTLKRIEILKNQLQELTKTNEELNKNLTFNSDNVQKNIDSKIDNCSKKVEIPKVDDKSIQESQKLLDSIEKQWISTTVTKIDQNDIWLEDELKKLNESNINTDKKLKAEEELYDIWYVKLDGYLDEELQKEKQANDEKLKEDERYIKDRLDIFSQSKQNQNELNSLSFQKEKLTNPYANEEEFNHLQNIQSINDEIAKTQKEALLYGEEGLEITDKQAKAWQDNIDFLNDKKDLTQEIYELENNELLKIQNLMVNHFQKGFEEILTGAKSLGDGLEDIFKNIGRDILSNITSSIAGDITQLVTGIGKNLLGSFIGNLSGGSSGGFNLTSLASLGTGGTFLAGAGNALLGAGTFGSALGTAGALGSGFGAGIASWGSGTMASTIGAGASWGGMAGGLATTAGVLAPLAIAYGAYKLGWSGTSTFEKGFKVTEDIVGFLDDEVDSIENYVGKKKKSAFKTKKWEEYSDLTKSELLQVQGFIGGLQSLLSNFTDTPLVIDKKLYTSKQFQEEGIKSFFDGMVSMGDDFLNVAGDEAEKLKAYNIYFNRIGEEAMSESEKGIAETIESHKDTYLNSIYKEWEKFAKDAGITVTEAVTQTFTNIEATRRRIATWGLEGEELQTKQLEYQRGDLENDYSTYLPEVDLTEILKLNPDELQEWFDKNISADLNSKERLDITTMLLNKTLDLKDSELALANAREKANEEATALRNKPLTAYRFDTNSLLQDLTPDLSKTFDLSKNNIGGVITEVTGQTLEDFKGILSKLDGSVTLNKEEFDNLNSEITRAGSAFNEYVTTLNSTKETISDLITSEEQKLKEANEFLSSLGIATDTTDNFYNSLESIDLENLNTEELEKLTDSAGLVDDSLKDLNSSIEESTKALQDGANAILLSSLKFTQGLNRDRVFYGNKSYDREAIKAYGATKSLETIQSDGFEANEKIWLSVNNNNSDKLIETLKGQGLLQSQIDMQYLKEDGSYDVVAMGEDIITQQNELIGLQAEGYYQLKDFKDSFSNFGDNFVSESEKVDKALKYFNFDKSTVNIEDFVDVVNGSVNNIDFSEIDISEDFSLDDFTKDFAENSQIVTNWLNSIKSSIENFNKSLKSEIDNLSGFYEISINKSLIGEYVGRQITQASSEGEVDYLIDAKAGESTFKLTDISIEKITNEIIEDSIKALESISPEEFLTEAEKVKKLVMDKYQYENEQLQKQKSFVLSLKSSYESVESKYRAVNNISYAQSDLIDQIAKLKTIGDEYLSGEISTFNTIYDSYINSLDKQSEIYTQTLESIEDLKDYVKDLRLGNLSYFSTGRKSEVAKTNYLDSLELLKGAISSENSEDISKYLSEAKSSSQNYLSALRESGNIKDYSLEFDRVVGQMGSFTNSINNVEFKSSEEIEAEKSTYLKQTMDILSERQPLINDSLVSIDTYFKEQELANKQTALNGLSGIEAASQVHLKKIKESSDNVEAELITNGGINTDIGNLDKSLRADTDSIQATNNTIKNNTSTLSDENFTTKLEDLARDITVPLLSGDVGTLAIKNILDNIYISLNNLKIDVDIDNDVTITGMSATATTTAGYNQTTTSITPTNGVLSEFGGGWSSGGFTGFDKGVNEAVGVVHGKEYVAPYKQIQKYPELFEQLERDRKGFKSGGFTTPISLPKGNSNSNDLIKKLDELIQENREMREEVKNVKRELEEIKKSSSRGSYFIEKIFKSLRDFFSRSVA